MTRPISHTCAALCDSLCLRPTWDPLQQKDVRGPANLEALSKWTCKGCGESQYHTYMKCSKCNTYRPPEADPSLRKSGVASLVSLLMTPSASSCGVTVAREERPVLGSLATLQGTVHSS